MKKTRIKPDWNKLIAYAILTVIVAGAFLFRIKGIADNHSFWADEAWVSTLARDVLGGKRTLLEAVRLLDYQPLHIIVTLFSFALLGAGEFAARLPVAIAGTLGVIGAYLAASRLSNRPGGLLAAFLVAFSQLNLAHSTQAKPYIALQTIIFFVIYLLTLLDRKSKQGLYFHVGIVVLCSLSTVMHILGSLAWLPYLAYLFLAYRRNLRQLMKRPAWLFALAGIILLSTLPFSGWNHIFYFFDTGEGNVFFTRNQITYVREFFWKNYAFITLPALFGLASIFSRYRAVALSAAVWMLAYLYMFSFKSYTHNVRYLVPFIGVLFVFFAVFWAQIGGKFFTRKAGIVCLIVAAVLYLGGYKVARKPAAYYTPNADLYGDIQVADYRTVFTLIKDRFPDLAGVAVFNDFADAQEWYLPEKPVTALFVRKTKDTPRQTRGVPVYTSLSDMQVLMKKHPRGLLIVEDWESILPEEIKQYAKKSLKREFRVEGLPQAAGDNWPIEVYSWGLP